MTVPTPEPRVQRFEDERYGLCAHWGLYSMLGRGEWAMFRENIPAEEYNKLAQTFTAEDFDARAWARMCKDAGMKFAILTTRHHDGFSLYDARGLSDFDAPHSAAKRDLIAEFCEGCRDEGIMPYFYHTTLDWQWQSQACNEAKFNEYLDYLLASVEVLCQNYGPIGGLNFDGNWSRWEADWKEERLYAMIHKNQPECIIINNPGVKMAGTVSSPNLDVVNFEQHRVAAVDHTGQDRYRAARLSQTLTTHWGYAANEMRYKSPEEVIKTIAKCLRVNAVYSLNIGPGAQGHIPEMDLATLRLVGRWCDTFADAIYDGVKPCPEVECVDDDFVTRKGDKMYYYAQTLSVRGHWTTAAQHKGAGPRPIKNLGKKVTSAKWLDNNEQLEVTTEGDTTSINCTGYAYGIDWAVRVAELTVA